MFFVYPCSMSHRSQASERSAAGLCTMTKQPSASRMMFKLKWNDPNKNTSNLGLRTPWLGREKLVDRLTSNDALRYLTLPQDSHENFNKILLRAFHWKILLLQHRLAWVYLQCSNAGCFLRKCMNNAPKIGDSSNSRTFKSTSYLNLGYIPTLYVRDKNITEPLKLYFTRNRQTFRWNT